MKIKMLRKDANGNVEVFYVDNVRDKKLHDTERKKERRLNLMAIRETERDRKQDLQSREKLASELRKIKMKRKELE